MDLKECPLELKEFEAPEAPLCQGVLERGDQEVSLEDLDSLQQELETQLSSVVVRKRELRQEGKKRKNIEKYRGRKMKNADIEGEESEEESKADVVELVILEDSMDEPTRALPEAPVKVVDEEPTDDLMTRIDQLEKKLRAKDEKIKVLKFDLKNSKDVKKSLEEGWKKELKAKDEEFKKKEDEWKTKLQAKSEDIKNKLDKKDNEVKEKLMAKDDKLKENLAVKDEELKKALKLNKEEQETKLQELKTKLDQKAEEVLRAKAELNSKDQELKGLKVEKISRLQSQKEIAEKKVREIEMEMKAAEEAM